MIPAVLSYSFDDFEKKLKRVEGIFERVQFDLIGKVFSAETTIGLESLEKVGGSFGFDVHMMVKEPELFLSRCDVAGVERVFGQVEHMKDRRAFVEHAYALGMEVGLGLDLDTPVSVIEKDIPDLDAVLLMSVLAGKSGQLFNERVIEKIRQVREISSAVPICIDGGIRPATVKKCYDAGASEFGVTSFIWESKDVREARDELVEALE